MSAVYEKENEIIRRTRNKEKLPPIQWVPEDVAYVCSLYPKAVDYGQTQFGPVVIQPCKNKPREIVENPEKFKPAFFKVEGCFIANDKGNDERVPQYIPARERAKDMAERRAQFGVFMPAGDRPTKEECAEALKKLEATYRQWIDITDDMWARTGRVKDGISTARLAVQHFGLEREWAERTQEQDVCPYCNRSVRSKAVKCGNPNCGAILDWKRAYDGGLVTKEQAAEHGVKMP